MLHNDCLDKSPVVRRNGLISEEMSGEYVVYDQVRKKAHHLNPTLSWIWCRCDGVNTVKDLASAFASEYKVDDGSEVMLAGLEQLQGCRLLDSPVIVPRPATSGGVLTRRAVVAGGAVVWPAIVSMVAPTAAAALSKPGQDKDKDKGKDNKKTKR